MPIAIEWALATVVAATAAAAANMAATRDDAASPTEPADDADRFARDGQYLAAIAALERRLERRPADAATLNQLATLRSFVGDGEGAREAMERLGAPSRGSPPSAALAATLARCTPADALAEIVRQAATRQIVIINEAHHVPQHRAFTLALAERLRPLDFDWFACETYTADCRALPQRGYPTRATGYYTNEPLFGDLVRRAVKLGYQPMHYEIEYDSASAGATASGDMTDGINRREIAQSTQLVERIFKNDPTARVLIHCGYSHATEDWSRPQDGRELAWMAARLAKLLGTDPLTIDQTEQTPGGAPQSASAAWSFAERQGWLHRPTLLRRADGNSFVDGDGWAGRIDLQVFHPAMTLVDGRPDWMHATGDRRPTEVPVELEPEHGRHMIEAFLAAESDDAVPLDRIVITAGEPCPVLLLAPGRYRVVAHDEGGARVGACDLVQPD